MTPHLLISDAEPITLTNDRYLEKVDDVIRRYPIPGQPAAALRLSADIRAEGMTGPPSKHAMVFFNVEFTEGAIFWDNLFLPATGTTPWQRHESFMHPRGKVDTVELHVRYTGKGTLHVRNIQVEQIEPWDLTADAVVTIFGDSTDMTNNVEPAHRLSRMTELLLQDRFFHHTVKVHGLAEGGDCLRMLLTSGRLERDLKSLPQTDIVMFRYGLNDVSKKTTPEEFYTYLNEACDIVHRYFPQARIVLSTTIPRFADAMDEQTRRIASERQLPLIPLDALIRERSAQGDWDWHHEPGHRIGRRQTQNPPENPTGLGGDLHPNAYGARLIAEYYAEHLEPIIAKILDADA